MSRKTLFMSISSMTKTKDSFQYGFRLQDFTVVFFFLPMRLPWWWKEGVLFHWIKVLCYTMGSTQRKVINGVYEIVFSSRDRLFSSHLGVEQFDLDVRVWGSGDVHLLELASFENSDWKKSSGVWRTDGFYAIGDPEPNKNNDWKKRGPPFLVKLRGSPFIPSHILKKAASMLNYNSTEEPNIVISKEPVLFVCRTTNICKNISYFFSIHSTFAYFQEVIVCTESDWKTLFAWFERYKLLQIDN